MRQSVRFSLSALSLCLIAVGSAGAADTPLGEMQLLPGYAHRPLQGIDSIVGEIAKDGGLKMSYEIGHVSKPGEPMVGGGFRDRPKLMPKEDMRWYREQTINGQPVHIAFSKKSTLLVSFPEQGMNFRATIQSSEQFADAMLMILTYPKSTVPEAKKTDVTLTPTQPHLLPDGSTRLLVQSETIYEDRMRFGTSQLTHKDLTLDIVPNTVIASEGYLFHLTTPHSYEFGHVRESDMIFTVVDSCKCSVVVEKGKAPLLQLKALKGNLPFACDNRRSSQLGSIRGVGKHFIAVRVGRTEIYRRAPSNVLGTGMDVFVVTNFGAQKIRLEYMQEKTVTIGPETISIESFNFDYPTKSVEIKVSTVPKVAEAEAFIVEYSNSTVDVEPATQAGDGIDVDLLAGAWTHSYEEDEDFEGKVFRPTDSKKFPPSRFRKRYVFNKDGSGEFLYLHPADAHRMVACQWKVAQEDPRRIGITAMIGGEKRTESIEVLELTKDILRVK